MSLVSDAARRTPGLLSAVGQRLEALPVVAGLGVLVVLQVAQAFWFAFSTPHNGWIWYSGGDATSYWTEQWAVGHLQIPQAAVGYALPVYYAWVPLVAGPSLMTGAAVIVLFQMIVLVPLALVLFWAIADRLFGRVYAWFAAALWVAGPALLLLGFVQKYHWVFDQLFLVPHWFGLTNMGDLPSLVAVLGCVLFALRAVDTGSSTDAVLAGLVGGLALGIKPSNGFFVPAIAVLLFGARRWRLSAIAAAAAVPALLTLSIWKERGLGTLPVVHSAYAGTRLAAGSVVVASSTSRYLPLDFHHLGEELRNLHEVFWSLRLLEFLIVAGAFGLIRKSPLRGIFVLVWFAAYGIVKATSSGADFPSATYYRLAEPGLPAFILLVVGVAFCVPAWGKRRAEAPRPADAPIQWRRVAPAAVVLGAVPLLLVAVLQNPTTMHIARDENAVQEAPLTSDLHPVAHHASGSTTISWRAADTGSSRPWYTIYYAPTKNSLVSNDNGCTRPDHGANECFLNTALRLGYTQSTSFTDTAPTPGRWYRVAVLAGYQKATPGGDLMLVSNAVGGPSS